MTAGWKSKMLQFYRYRTELVLLHRGLLRLVICFFVGLRTASRILKNVKVSDEYSRATNMNIRNGELRIINDR